MMIHASHASSPNTTDLWKRSGFSATLLVFFFFALWKDADSDIPILKEAKAEYAKLQ